MTHLSLARMLIVAAAAGAPLAAFAQQAGIELPPVSCATLTEQDPAQASTWLTPGTPAAGPLIRTVSATAQPASSNASTSPFLPGWKLTAVSSSVPASMTLGPQVIIVAPGSNAMVEAAINHLNRIVTPFASPEVHTVSEAATQVDANVVYVAPASEAPVSLYLTDQRDPETAISLTLAPRYVPPREIRVQVTGYRGGPARRSSAAPASAISPIETATAATFSAHPYVEGITEVLLAMAQDRLPPGYRVSKRSGRDRVSCSPALRPTNRRLASGPLGRVLSVSVRNKTKTTVPIDDRSCTLAAGSKRVVAASAAWPKSLLGPGESTQLFLVLQDQPAGGLK